MSSLHGIMKHTGLCHSGSDDCSAAPPVLPPLPPLSGDLYPYMRSTRSTSTFSTKRRSDDSKSTISTASSASIYSTASTSTSYSKSVSSLPMTRALYNAPAMPDTRGRPQTARKSDYDSMLHPRAAPAPPPPRPFPTMPLPPIPRMLHCDNEQAARAAKSKMGDESYLHQEK